MSEVNFNNIFKQQLSSSIDVNSPFQEPQLHNLFQKINEMVNQIQQNYDKKVDFRKSESPKMIVNCFAEAINSIYTSVQTIESQKQQLNQAKAELEKAKKTISELKANKDSLQTALNQQEQGFHDIFLQKQTEINQLRNEIEELQKKKKYDESNDSDKQYDITVDIKSLVNIQKEPIRVIYSQERGITKQCLEEMEHCSFVAILGLKNKGKTFLLNELNNENFPSGYHYSTSGISVKIDNSDRNNIKVYLDSEGINKPARYNWSNDSDFQDYIKLKQENDDASCNYAESQFKRNFQTKVTEKFQDIKSTEQIQMQFLLEHSETIIIVVGIISLEEQKIISVISEMFDKDIIVVHNLKEYSRCEHVKNEIENNLYDLFPLERRGIQLFNKAGEENEFVYQDQRNERVFHCVLAKKDTPAGEFYNKFSYDYIKQKIQLNENKKSMNIAQDFSNFLNKCLRDFLDIGYSSQEKKNLKVPLSDVLLSIEEKETCDEITLLPEYEIQGTKDILLDVFGRFRNMINYSIHLQGYKKILEIELPGDTKLTKASLIKEDEYQVMVIQANKQIVYQDQQGIQEIFNNRNLGQVYHKIKVGKTTENLKITKKFTEKRGIYTCEFEITKPEYTLSIEQQNK
ncbi:hypothetical protein TTHERM_00836650 (macronuclear) [Tetrahymena thermophila SB210]|uniref:50S ribosome-binding GTPase n=1 Tax=Tetrahymena thermophila (strain SB210) TaxID=312017 RepID=I7LXN6_TETTS|nr:hypothetical protein TTHERM_00836650 [Tetrahymena thermophila SB210]EAS04993.1 hypothetical protein TTHERM_00836650 [Tetrahymena thermophila SB210]|eukprot:XP_001025238.1 hypothetical protein TTHERM_00836650 [Tetrahymena thermophila SB210]